MAQRTAAAQHRGEEFRGYAIRWAEVYAHIASLLARQPEIARRVIVVRYEYFCSAPKTVLDRLRDQLQVPPTGDAAASLPQISISTVAEGKMNAGEHVVVWDETAAVARSFGYRDRGGDTPSPA